MNPTAFRNFPVIALAALAICPNAVFAHKVTSVSVITELDTKAQTYRVELAMEVNPTGDAAIDDVITPEQAATDFATEALAVYFDDEEIELGAPEVRIVTESDEKTPVELRQQKAVTTFQGEIPEGADNFMLYVNETTEANVVMLVYKDGKPSRRLQVLYPGEFSNPENVEPVIEADPFPKETKAKENATRPWPWIPVAAALLAVVSLGIFWIVRRRG